jgi:hypothetical protein
VHVFDWARENVVSEISGVCFGRPAVKLYGSYRREPSLTEALGYAAGSREKVGKV